MVGTNKQRTSQYYTVDKDAPSRVHRTGRLQHALWTDRRFFKGTAYYLLIIILIFITLSYVTFELPDFTWYSSFIINFPFTHDGHWIVIPFKEMGHTHPHTHKNNKKKLLINKRLNLEKKKCSLQILFPRCSVGDVQIRSPQECNEKKTYFNLVCIVLFLTDKCFMYVIIIIMKRPERE